jgi:hypothetical protein
VGIAGVFLGYVLGASGDSSGDGAASVPSDLVVGSLTEPDPEERAPGAGLVDDPIQSGIAGAVSTTTTTSTTLAPSTPDPILRDRIPALRGRQLVGIGPGGAFQWRDGSRTPQIIDLPNNSDARWNPTGNHLAFVKYEPSNSALANELWLSYLARDPQPLWIGVTSFAWHPTEERVAWIGVAPTSTTWHLMWADVTAYGLDGIDARDLGIEADLAGDWMYLAGYGDYGWVMSHTRLREGEYESQIVTITADGIEATSDGLGERFVHSVSPDGRILVIDVRNGSAEWRDMSLTLLEPADLGSGSIQIDWAPESGQTLTFDDRGPTVRIAGPEPEDLTEMTLPPGAYSPALSADGQVAVALAHIRALETTVYVREPPADDEWMSVDVRGDWWFVDVGG